MTPEDRKAKRSAHARKAKKTPKPPRPWDIPPGPPPEAADKDIATVYTAVGEALSAWERMEERLASLFAIFIGLQGPSTAAERAYGSVMSFHTRKGMLEEAGTVYFRKHPDAESQALFGELIQFADGFCGRRNDIAHGKVMSFLRPGSREFIFLLWPAFYNSNKVNWRGTAKFVYNSAMIRRFAAAFDDIQNMADRLIHRIEERHAPPLAISSEPTYE
jgi:hypothetical protein